MDFQKHVKWLLMIAAVAMMLALTPAVVAAGTETVSDETELKKALNDEFVSTIVLEADIGNAEFTAAVDGQTIDGAGHTLTGNLNVAANGVIIKDLTIDGNLTVKTTADGTVIKRLTVKGDFTNHGPNTAQQAVIVEGEIGGDKIGPTGPLFSGPQQQPFFIRTEESGLGAPMVDNQEVIGMRVRDEEGIIIGYSQYSIVPTQIKYFYKPTDSGNFKPLADLSDLPADLAQTTTVEGELVDYIVRVEKGTINRFPYGIAMLVSIDNTIDNNSPPEDVWNGKLLYSFHGGTMTGHTQGRFMDRYVLLDEFLSQGFAVAHSTGNTTGNTYNLVVNGETMMMVKDHFVALHGDPLYTVGMGGSGGAVQQYIIAQNHPGLLDGIIPAASYPDMVTQLPYAGDGFLMEYYMDTVTDWPVAGRWDSMVERQVFQGNAGSDIIGGTMYTFWAGATQIVMNPHFHRRFGVRGQLDPAFVNAFGEELIAATPFTHFEDLRNIYGVDEDGWAKTTWDNIGVQYGLQSLQDGLITKEEFFKLNEEIGGWKQLKDMVGVRFPHDYDNMQPERTEGNIEAIKNSYTHGIVFVGDIDIPVMDVRAYTDEILDYHHFRESFTARERINMAQGHIDNHVIWAAHWEAPLGLIQGKAYQVMDEWLLNIRENPDKSVAENKPAAAVDTAFGANGHPFDSGPDVWKEGSPGYEAFTPYKTPRMLAGAPTHGLNFKAYLIPVEEAFERGYYPDDFTDEDIARLKDIFPYGVADYEKPDRGMPDGIRILLGLATKGEIVSEAARQLESPGAGKGNDNRGGVSGIAR